MKRGFLTFFFLLVASPPLTAAETLDQLIAGAKKESELTFIAGAQTFGGAKTLSALEAAFNKKFGLNARIRFAAGPEMNAMAARVITEMKSGNKASTDIYHGSQSHLALLHREKALEPIWVTIGVKACKNESSVLMSKKPAPIIIKGEGMGTMTLSMMTPTKTLQGPWVRIESMIQLRISVNAVVLRLKVSAEDSSSGCRT